jgi:hypothetical protein
LYLDVPRWRSGGSAKLDGANGNSYYYDDNNDATAEFNDGGCDADAGSIGDGGRV